MRYFIELAYDGKVYCGWQIQPNAISIEETLEKALSLTSRATINIVGQGRTDAGVHALQSYAHFDIDTLPYDANLWVYKLNSLLPDDISIKKIIPVSADAHARFSALSRSYRYIISTAKDPFMQMRAWGIYRPLRIEKMREACEHIKGKHDFTSFSSAKSDTHGRVCHVTQLDITETQDQIWIDITADRFVMNMVRTIVGTLVEVGLNKREPSDIITLFSSLNRQKAGENAPPHALYLREVKYPPHIFTL